MVAVRSLDVPDEALSAQKRPWILIADDEPGMRNLCRLTLEQAGYQCDQAASGHEALAKAERGAYDLVVLDIQMPEVSGLEVLQRLQQFFHDRNVKVLLMSGHLAPDDLVSVLSSGADDCLTKPFTLVQLRERVKAMLRLKQAQDHSNTLNQHLLQANAELARADELLRLANAELENRVQARTADLLVANQALQIEIGERRQAEETARQAHTEMKALLTSISSILIGLNADGRITHWNKGAEVVFGIPACDALTRPFAECNINWADEQLAQHLQECRDRLQPVRSDDVAFTRPDRTCGYLGFTITPFFQGEERRPGVLLLGTDLTERRLLLVQAQKLEAIGQLAAGIAHEINTPIQYVGDNTNFLCDAFRDLDQVLKAYEHLTAAVKQNLVASEHLAAIEHVVAQADLEYLSEEIPRAISQTLEGVKHVAKIVRAMKQFSHPGGEEKTPADLNLAIQNTITVARNEWKYVADVVTDLDPSLPLVPCLLGELNQVLLNLLVNAADAIGEKGGAEESKGTITVATRHLDPEVEIRVSDSGSGIPEAVLPRIFDPFFTTKPVGKGTGQGLAITHAVITKKHRGTITCETAVGKGTTFIIRLPLDPAGDSAGRKGRD